MEITIKCPDLLELAKAIVLLAQAKSPQTVNIQPTTSAPVQQAIIPMQAPVAPITPVNQTYVQAPVTQQFAPPIAQTSPPVQTQPPAVTSPIPTSHVAQEFTLDQISLAMAGLIDAGKMQVITEIMKSFNVAAITQLPKEQYPLLVVKLREAGAQI